MLHEISVSRLEERRYKKGALGS